MARCCWVAFLAFIYRLLIVRIQTLDKLRIVGYEDLKVLGVVSLTSNKGVFTFTFKEDRRMSIRHKEKNILKISSYFVELKCPPTYDDETNIFHKKAILIVKLKLKTINYDALGRVLLDTYIDTIKDA